MINTAARSKIAPSNCKWSPKGEIIKKSYYQLPSTALVHGAIIFSANRSDLSIV
jgi:hypothetical protein